MWSVNDLFNKLFQANNKGTSISTINEKEYLQLKEYLSMTTASPTILFGLSDKNLVTYIQNETAKYNVNNISRTKAYLDYFNRNKEIHWSFLAHMVSRNGGWNMTDLKGGLIHQLLPSNKQELFFIFLERANAFIFHDAYPQLLLYEQSKKTGRNLFYLLPYFSVSSFMKTIWEYFWIEKNSELLTIALILNEQCMIQARLIENSSYDNEVLDSSLYKTQETFGFTDVLFPYKKFRRIELAGTTVHGFKDVRNRINIGKSLYGILFHKVYKHAYDFAISTPHTGSRKDFWPHLFTSKDGKNSNKIYSPELTEVWPNINHSYKTEDWFTNQDMLDEMITYHLPSSFRMSKNYKADLKKLQTLKAAKNTLSK